MRLSLILIVLVALPAYSGGAPAEDADSSARIFSFNGFGTLGLVHSSEHNADFTTSIFKPNGAGYTHNWSPDVDSLIGGQLTANITPRLSAVVQAISEQRYDKSYTPYVEWANLKYQFTPDFSARIGRFVLSSFFVADYRKVGYVNPWVRPPVEVYSLIPESSNDGLDASYRIHIGESSNTLQMNYGRSNTKFPAGGAAKGDDSWGFSDTAEYGALTVRLSYQQTKLTIEPLNAFFNAYRQFGPQGIALADRYDPKKRLWQFVGIGALYDPGQWFVTGEWGTDVPHSVIRRQTSSYVTAGYRYKELTPYLTYARVTANNRDSDPGLADPNATGLNFVLNAILQSIAVQSTDSIGGRWDLVKNVALKVQYDRTHLAAGSPGTLSNLQSGFRPGGTVNLITVAVDFAF